MSPVRVEKYEWNYGGGGPNPKERRSTVNWIKQRGTIGGLPAVSLTDILEPLSVAFFDHPNVVTQISGGIHIKEFADKLGAQVNVWRGGKTLKGRLREDGHTAICTERQQLITVTLYRRDGKYDSGDESGDFGKTFSL